MSSKIISILYGAGAVVVLVGAYMKLDGIKYSSIFFLVGIALGSVANVFHTSLLKKKIKTLEADKSQLEQRLNN
ncbi:MAG: hypothetical protein PHU27_01575 [Salinivirgaceae bacterium]|nr:hypothetical protein [Salinivirgaceae bacterium]MDD4746484.1 hypothetical protein [Salinivirgaceae bacterium]